MATTCGRSSRRRSQHWREAVHLTRVSLHTVTETRFNSTTTPPAICTYTRHHDLSLFIPILGTSQIFQKTFTQCRRARLAYATSLETSIHCTHIRALSVKDIANVSCFFIMRSTAYGVLFSRDRESLLPAKAPSVHMLGAGPPVLFHLRRTRSWSFHQIDVS